MTARRLALAWSAGCCVGVAVGALAGSAVRVAADFRALRAAVRPRDGLAADLRPGARSNGNGAQEGAQRLRWVDLFGIDPDYTDGLPVDEFIERNRAGFGDPIPAQRDDEPCQQRSPGGGLICCRTGHHTAHLFEGSHARDRKADADEEVE